MEGGGRQSVSFKYTNSIQRPGARAQGLGKMVTNTEVSTQGKAEDGKDLDTRDPPTRETYRMPLRTRQQTLVRMQIHSFWMFIQYPFKKPTQSIS